MKAQCDFEGCERPRHSANHCFAHYRQLMRGKQLTPLRRYKKQQVLPNGHRQCNLCEYFKKPDDFYDLPSGGKRTKCKQCEIDAAIERQNNNRRKAA